MGVDYVPRADRSFGQWVLQFLKGLQDRQRLIGIPDSQMARLQAQIAAFSSAQEQHDLALQQAATAKLEKDQLRSTCEKAIRQAVHRINACPAITPADREAMQIRVFRKRISPATAAKAPASEPRLRVEVGPQTHTIRVVDSATPDRKARPRLVSGFELWQAYVDERTPREADWRYLRGYNATPAIVKLPLKRAGERVWYRARWQNTHGIPGPWSNAAMAMVMP